MLSMRQCREMLARLGAPNDTMEEAMHVFGFAADTRKLVTPGEVMEWLTSRRKPAMFLVDDDGDD